jgi:hypothetical protein
MDETAQVARWAKTESQKLQETHRMGSPLETEVIETWKRVRPRMVRDLEKHQAVKPLAHVLVDRMLKAWTANEKAGLPPTDAREEAEKDWLLLEPEEDEIASNEPLQQLVRTTMFLTPRA